MTDCSDRPGEADAPAPSDGARPGGAPGAGARLGARWHRIRSGEDPWAFGAVVIVVALAAGLLWFWAGARHGGVAVASASPGPSKGAGARPGCGAAQPPGRSVARFEGPGEADATATPPWRAPAPDRNSVV